ncbi:MAG: hypothetical protein MR383_05020 [Lachnospiraceae bacterium]|nr:hypothetical protein [Lachnospiraceae bacterium]
MRKRQKQDILEILQSLYEANREIEAALKNKQPELARNMLCDCQECAIELGNVIDQAEGEGTEAVSYLEKYCEVLFHYHQKLSEMEQLDKKAVEKIKKALDKQIREIENSIRNNIPERQEIVFMPYKASMWDSLESVYLAAKEDPDCDAYCVPIPYFDKNPDGSLGQMHYEIDQYPKNIEVVNRLNYKLEERRPDVIYIHNPYDECNHVTCVHPDYFSSRLKQYTDKLVYIPYFVLQEIEPDDEKSIEQMRHFCFLPGTINADRVIVQSEKMRQIYINEYLKAAKVYGLTGEHLDRAKLEEKFLGLGSPKFDKVVNTRKEDMDVPSEWLKVIEKENGSWKKIILYNTSINALLKHEEQMLIKMKSVFELFKEHQKEVALLWRPHPLIPSTIQSMRPQLWEKYKEIVEQYKEEGWGIYDDSSDLDRAVVLSDGYYGDPSSVVDVYEKTEKPILIQTCSGNKEINILKYVYSTAGVIDGERIYLASGYDNLIFVIDKKTMTLIESIEIEPEKKGVVYPMSKAIDFGNYIIGIPFSQRFMFKLNKTNGVVEKVDITHNNKIAFSGCLYKDEIWLFPLMNFSSIPIININNLKNKIVSSVFSKFDFAEKYQKEYGHNIFTQIHKMGEVVYFALRHDKKMYSFQLNTQIWNEYELPDPVVELCCEKNVLWILFNTGKIGKWECGNGLIFCHDINNFHSVGKLTFSDIAISDEYIWCLPAIGNEIVIIEKSTLEERIIELCPNKNSKWLCSHYMVDREKLYVFSQECSKVWMIDQRSLDISEREILIPDKVTEKMKKRKNIWYEMYVPLQELIFKNT